MRDPRLDDLMDADPEVRADAREELLIDMDDEIADGFLAIASGDASEEVRGDAIIGLGPILEECGDEYLEGEQTYYANEEMAPPLSFAAFERMRTGLRALYSDESQPTLVRRRAFESLVRDPQPWHREDIKRLAASADKDWIRTAVFSMAYFDGFEEATLSMLNHDDSELVFEAVRAAGGRELTASAERIRSLARSAEDRDVMMEAITALPYVDPDAIDLLDELAESEDADVAEAAEAAREELVMLASGEFDDDFEDEDEVGEDDDDEDDDDEEEDDKTR